MYTEYRLSLQYVLYSDVQNINQPLQDCRTIHHPMGLVSHREPNLDIPTRRSSRTDNMVNTHRGSFLLHHPDIQYEFVVYCFN